MIIYRSELFSARQRFVVQVGRRMADKRARSARWYAPLHYVAHRRAAHAAGTSRLRAIY